MSSSEHVTLDYARVLVTGAAGYLGTLVRASLHGRVGSVRLSDIAPLAAERAGEEAWPCDLRDATSVRRAMDGVDAVVHLGASLNVDDWQETLDVNIAGCYNVYAAARAAGVRRVVYASSHHAVGMYATDERIGVDVRLRPDSLYGLSKCFGEALAQYCWDKFGLESVCLRIGSTRPAPSLAEPREFVTWLSEPDFERLLLASLATPSVGCTIVYGASLNGEAWWDNREADHLGFTPQDRAVAPAADAAAGPSYPLQGGKRAMLGLLAGADRLCTKR